MIASSLLLAGALLALRPPTEPSPQPLSAGQIIARSIEAHGGEALTRWKTMVVKGEVNQKDNRLWFRGEYILYAQKPNKLRADTDLTKYERGRYFYSQIYNDGKGWMIRNLLPVYGDRYATQLKARLDRCDGVALYGKADSLALLPEEELEGKPVYVIEAVLGGEKARLYIDKESLYLVQEVFGDLTWVYSDFKELGGAVRASHIREITTGRGGEEKRYVYLTVELDVPIAPEIFEEDMPK